MDLEFHTADAFTRRAFQGAQVAVFPDAGGLEKGQMQRLAAELNLSETVFVTTGEAVEGRPRFRLRTFSPAQEIEFAGHPIIATGAVLGAIGALDLASGEASAIFEQAGGTSQVHVRGRPGAPEHVQFGLVVKPATDRFVPPTEEIARFLGVEPSAIDRDRYHPMMVSCGRPYLIVPLRRYEAVRAAKFGYEAWTTSAGPTVMADETLVFSPRAADPRAQFHARLLGPRIARSEDPPVGSAMPAFAAYLCAHEHVARGTHGMTVERGTLETRSSLLDVEFDHAGRAELAVRLGGPAVAISRGRIRVPELAG